MFFRDGRVISLSPVRRSPRIPLGISVENRVLEIVGLESRSRLIIGDFADGSVLLDHSCVARCSALIPRLRRRVFGCLAGILGESRDSGLGPGLDYLAS